MVGQFGNVEQAFQTVFQAHKDAEVGDLGNGYLWTSCPGWYLPGMSLRPRIFAVASGRAQCGDVLDRPRGLLHSTSWPFSSISLGWLILRVQDMSDTCSRPSMPSSISMNAP